MMRRRTLVILCGVVVCAVAIVVVLALHSAQQARVRLYAQALALMDKRQWVDAKRVWEKLGAYRDAPAQLRSTEYQYAVAAAWEEMDKGYYETAVGGFQQALGFAPGSEAEQGLAKAKRLLANQRHKQAVEMVKAGDAARAAKRWEDAVSSYLNAMVLDQTLKARIAGRMAEAEKALNAQRERERREAAQRQERQRREPERQRLRDIGANMNTYDRASGSDVAIAVVKVKLTTRVNQSSGYYRYVKGDSRFVWVLAAARNYGQDIVHVNPNHFTLATPDGYTVSHDSTTYSLGNYFDAVDLRPGAETSGWLIFILTKHKEYVLNYQGFSGRAQKRIVAP